ncbi:MAG: FkbM family methyltransferase [Proteobacteria bacterium]|nr:FkbM family methyltransferase [Pseudomonadota bacterium]
MSAPDDRGLRGGAVHDGRRFGLENNAIYRLLGRLAPGLCIDVGAAIGQSCTQILENSPEARVIAYEPFPGNLRQLTAGFGRKATIRAAAVADRKGRERFSVPFILPRASGALPMGYSGVGRLDRTAKGAAVLDVDVVTLDDEIPEHVRLLKIDTQGAELRVLNGARGLIARHGIDMIYLEFNGSLAILRLLDALGYVVFDSAYMIWPVRRYYRNWLSKSPARIVPGWQAMSQKPLSVGKMATIAWPHVPARGFAAYCAWFWANRIARVGMQTDLICIHRDFLPEVWDALYPVELVRAQTAE